MGKANPNKKYHYFYQIVNNINQHFYYGIHSTDNLDDGYMGSGVRLHRAYKKYGIENFSKEILKFFDTRKDAADYEAEIVTESLMRDDNCYNIAHGGENPTSLNMVAVYDKVEGINKRINREEFLNNSERFVSPNKGKVTVYDTVEKVNKCIDCSLAQSDTVRYQHILKRQIIVKDKSGKCYSVSRDDERIKTGELRGVWVGLKHTEEYHRKVRETYKKIKHQQGERNSQYGTCWIYNAKTQENLRIKREDLDLYLQQGYTKGRLVDKKGKYDDILDVNIINNYRKQGFGFKKIGDMYGVYPKIIKRYCERNNIK